MTTCLVIEDSDRVRAVVMEALTALGLDPVGAAFADDGVSLAQTKAAEVVLLDWDLPKLGALDFLTKLAKGALPAKPTIILMATENDPKQFSLARSAGASHYVLKPFDRDDLALVLERAGFSVKREAA